MSIVLDASALLALHVESPSRHIVEQAMEDGREWCACAVALPESIAAATRMTDEPVLQREIEDMIRHTWDFLHVVPADRSLLDDAAELAVRQPIGVSAAMHLAAAARLPRPVRFVTFDPAQIPVALSLGFDVVSG